MIVHRYDSLSLLNQVVFTKDRPRSRLARSTGNSSGKSPDATGLTPTARWTISFKWAGEGGTG